MLIVRYYRYDERIVTLHLSPHPHLVLVAHHHAVLRITGRDDLCQGKEVRSGISDCIYAKLVVK